jgi:NAD-dependent SIR2 family protein deacetylase
MSDIDQVKQLIRQSKCPLVLSGAGISAASGVPITQVNHSDTSFLTEVTTQAFEQDPKRVWDLHLGLRRRLAECRPNAAHLALREWSNRIPFAVVTQNIDGLHELTAHSRLRVVSYHGTIWENRCVQCAEIRPDRTLEYTGLPHSDCHPDDMDRPNITWIGDGINSGKKEYAKMLAQVCDLVLIIGTSLHVGPFNVLPIFAKKRSAPIIGINPEKNELFADLFDVQLEGKAEELLPELIK